MKSHHLFLLLLVLPLIALWGCEGDQGPAGPAGADGINGVDGTDGTDGVDGMDGANGYSPAMCLDCHNDSASLEIQLAYAKSGHKAGLYVDYAGGRAACGSCHGKQGFIEYAVTGTVSGDISDPAPIDCATCHTVHPGTFGIRLTDPVAANFGEYTFDLGDNSNLCANCHQARTAEPNTASPGETFNITSTHYGPHHGPQANVWSGYGFAEIEGSTAYPASNLHANAGATCVTCHMGDYADGAGGHSWIPTVDSCNNCHATSDFNYGGVQTEIEDLLVEVRDQLVTLGVVEYVEADDAYEPITGSHPMIQAQAYYNWIGLEEDRSLGVHNPRYVKALLENTLEAITPAP